MTRARIPLFFPVIALLSISACDPIVGTPPEAIPFNTCPEIACPSGSSCSEGRCQAQGVPSFEYLLVVDLPSTSFYGAGMTFLLPSRDLSGTDKVAQCPIGRTCFRLPQLATVETSYRITPNAATVLGVEQAAVTSVPQVTFIPLSPGFSFLSSDTRLASNIGLPLQDVTTLRTNDTLLPPTAETILTPGPYTRLATPSPQTLPPVINSDTLSSGKTTDAILIQTIAECANAKCAHELDEQPGAPTRLLQISRQGGLDGYRAWLADASNTRVSSLRTLGGASAVADLSTVGQASPLDANVIVAPPSGAVGMPMFVNRTLAGTIPDRPFPALPPPATVEGQVVDGGTVGVSASIVFDSVQVALVAPDAPSPFLTYRTTVATDPEGRFATVVPPGSYSVTVIPDPLSGSGVLFGSNVTISADGSLSPFVVPAKSAVSGKVMLADGRLLAGADVRATPSVSQANDPYSAANPTGAQPRTTPWLFPRETHARTNPDGTFVLFADVGTYDLTIAPQTGTGFPRLVSRALQVAPAANAQDVAVIQQPFKVPPPIALEYTVFDPTGSTTNTINGAIIRVFTSYPAPGQAGLLDYIEIGEGMTDANGNCEILVTPSAPQ